MRGPIKLILLALALTGLGAGGRAYLSRDPGPAAQPVARRGRPASSPVVRSRQIKEARRTAATTLGLEEKLPGQKHIEAREAQRHQNRRSLFDAPDAVDRQREALIAQIEGKMARKSELRALFALRWGQQW